MSELLELVKGSELRVCDVVVGMVTQVGVITNIPGYDLQLTVQVITQEEALVRSHTVVIPAEGQTAAELRASLIGKHVLTVKDNMDRALHPIRGRCYWSEKR